MPISSPSIRMLPRARPSSPVTISRQVVLPAPLRPNRPKNDPRGTSKLSPFMGVGAAVRLAQVAHFQHDGRSDQLWPS